MNWSIFIINILLHVGLMSLFLTIFFFTIAQYFEKKIVEDQISFVIDDFVGNTLKPIDDATKKEIKNKINDIFKNQDFSKEDDNVKEENKKIKKKAWGFVGVLLSIIGIIVVMAGFIYQWDIYYIKYLLSSSIFSLLFVAITETLFMFLIAQNYLSADPNKIKLNIIDTLIKNRCNPCKNPKLKNCLGPKCKPKP